MPKFVVKTQTKDSDATFNYANDLEKRIGDAVDPMDTKTQNLPDNGALRTQITSSNIEMGTGFNSGSIKAIKDNITGVGYLFGNIIATSSANPGATIFKLPSGFLPAYTQTFWVRNISDDSSYRITINPSGSVYIDTAITRSKTFTLAGIVFDLS